MIRLIFLWSFLLVLSVSLKAGELSDRLVELSTANNFSYDTLETDSFFSEKYVLYFDQYIDHQNPQAGIFTQRVFVSHRGFEVPVVFITEGYAAEYGNYPSYINELSNILLSNQIIVEHRYFGASTPENMDWQYLTIYNAASDHHHIVEVLKQLYFGKWVNTGISKGGQTAMYHRYYYPDDVDVSVGYVCPLNFSVEDKRVYRFLEQVGKQETRDKVMAFQQEMLMNKEIYLPEFELLAENKNLSYPMGMEKAFELTVLEYSFAFWQWGYVDPSTIPFPTVDTMQATEIKQMVNHLDRVAGISWISNEGIHELQPFFYQALAEIGFYGYDISPFRDWVSYTENPTFEFTAPQNTEIVWDPKPMQAVDHFIRHEADKMIFIYGETDPWSATSVDITYNRNILKIVKPGGSHTTRINNLPKEQKELVISTLKNWLEINKD